MVLNHVYVAGQHWSGFLGGPQLSICSPSGNQEVGSQQQVAAEQFSSLDQAENLAWNQNGPPLAASFASPAKRRRDISKRHAVDDNGLEDDLPEPRAKAARPEQLAAGEEGTPQRSLLPLWATQV